MNIDELSKLTDKEKIIIFNVTLEQAKENGRSFESQIGTVLDAFHISKSESEMNMAPKPELVQEKFEMNMAPKPELVQEKFEMNMAPNEYGPKIRISSRKI